MKKVIVLTKKNKKIPAGASFLAKNMALTYKNPFFISCHNKMLLEDDFIFDGAEKSDLIVIDDIPFHSEFCKKMIYQSHIVINRLYKLETTIELPDIVLVTNIDTENVLENLPNSILRRIRIIECSHENRVFNFKRIN